MRFDKPVGSALRTTVQGGFAARTKLASRVMLRFFPVGPIACNCVIVADDRSKHAVVVDPGDDAEVIVHTLRELQLNPVALLATHAHIDHVGALAGVKSATAARAMLHEADVPLYENLAIHASWLGVSTPAVTKIDGFLDDGDVLTFGSHSLRVIHTPGHSPGSISFFIDGLQPTLLSGDTLFAGGIGRTDLWGGSFEQIMRSIKNKLLTLDDGVVVVPGHGPQTTIGTERRTNPFVAGQP
jgi:hydroxyacylglutathione hydrolase